MRQRGETEPHAATQLGWSPSEGLWDGALGGCRAGAAYEGCRGKVAGQHEGS